jgi:peptide/nickel transport system permease protein
MALVRFLIRRILLGILVLWIISVAVFAMFFIAPHDPARLLAGKEATPQTVALISRRLGLDKPILVQYGEFFGRLLDGNLGYSYYNSEPVTHLIMSRLPVSVSLAVGAAVMWLVIGISAGVLAATRPRSLADRVVTACSLFFYSSRCSCSACCCCTSCSSGSGQPASTSSPAAGTSPWPTRCSGPVTCSCRG